VTLNERKLTVEITIEIAWEEAVNVQCCACGTHSPHGYSLIAFVYGDVIEEIPLEAGLCRECFDLQQALSNVGMN
jgi:hypothetical protein